MLLKWDQKKDLVFNNQFAAVRSSLYRLVVGLLFHSCLRFWKYNYRENTHFLHTIAIVHSFSFAVLIFVCFHVM